MFCIIANIFVMAMPMEQSSDSYNTLIDNLNMVFTAIFITEFAVKILALGIKIYFKNPWN